MMQFWKKKWLIAALVTALAGVSGTALAQPDEDVEETKEVEETEEAEETEEVEEAEEVEETEGIEELEEIEEIEEDDPAEFSPTFGVGIETGFFFTDLGRFNAHVLEPNGLDGFDVWGTPHWDLAVESRILENVRLSLLGGVGRIIDSDRDFRHWYVGIEPAYVAGNREWELAIGVSAAIGSMTVAVAEEELTASLTVVRPFLEVRRYVSEQFAVYARGGFNQWYPRNPRSDDWDLDLATGQTAGTETLSTGGIYAAVGLRFGNLLPPEPIEVRECEEETVEADCTDVPEPECTDEVLTTYGPVCDDGTCSYESTETACQEGYICGEVDGEAACVEEPECTEDQDCTEEPEPFCEDDVITSYAGRCEDGTCMYEPIETPCEEGYRCGMEAGEVACVEEPEEELVEIDEETMRIEISENIFFALNSDEIESSSFPLLNQMARILNENPHVTLVRIEGHTDNQGSAEHNKELSARRADSVRNALMERGVEGDRLEAEGFGLERPVAPNDTEEGRAQNRRVELHIVELDEDRFREMMQEEAEDAEESEEAEESDD